MIPKKRIKSKTLILTVVANEEELIEKYPNYRTNFNNIDEFLHFIIDSFIPYKVEESENFGYSVWVNKSDIQIKKLK